MGRACCLIRARETTVKSMHDHPSERLAASAPTKSRYHDAQNCSLFPKGSRSPASPAHLKKTTHTFFLEVVVQLYCFPQAGECDIVMLLESDTTVRQPLASERPSVLRTVSECRLPRRPCPLAMSFCISGGGTALLQVSATQPSSSKLIRSEVSAR